MAQLDKPRLFRKTVRICDAPSRPPSQPSSLDSSPLCSLTTHHSLQKFTFSSKLKSRIKRDEDCTIKGKTALPEQGMVRRVKRLSPAGRRTQVTSPLRSQKSRTPLKFTLTPSLPVSGCNSQHPSASPSPRGSYLTIDAINLELHLTALLAETETLPSPQRRRQAFHACLEVLGEVADKDPVYGRALKSVDHIVHSLLSESKAREVSELEERNIELKRYIKEQKAVIKEESDGRAAQERVVEGLSRERNLLWKKLEELQLQVRRAASRQGFAGEELDSKARKVEELEDQLRAARKRESRLLCLLEVMKETDTEREDAHVVPPLDLLLLKRDSRLPSKSHIPLTSERSTEDLKSSLSLDLSDDASCNY